MGVQGSNRLGWVIERLGSSWDSASLVTTRQTLGESLPSSGFSPFDCTTGRVTSTFWGGCKHQTHQYEEDLGSGPAMSSVSTFKGNQKGRTGGVLFPPAFLSSFFPRILGGN